MISVNERKWLLLVHQIPPRPTALRVKIWRRLQQIGAVTIKQSVYVLPFTEQSREDLTWTLREIVDGGGDGSIAEARFVEGLTDEQMISLFQNARASDYQKIIQEANTLLAEWSSDQGDPQDPAIKGPSQLSRLARRLNDLVAIDFFKAPERGTAEILLQNLEVRLAGQASTGNPLSEAIGKLKGRTWVTRENLFVDRLACGWLILRFVDRAATFKFVPDPQYTPGSGELRFDMFEGEYTHEGGCCTFEVMIQRLLPKDRTLVSMAEIVHDIDLKDGKYGRSETDGFKALLTGLMASQADDDRRMVEGCRLFDNLYAYYQRQKGN
ncbi:MAG: chromate resistance protein ChrB domain-containing protein [Pseudomonadota bacterium]